MELSSSTSSPKPFVIEYQALVEDYEKAERKVHNYLDEFRDNKNREYFNCSIAAAIVAIRDYATVIHEDVYYKTPKEIKRIEAKKASEVAEKKRREVISQASWNIKELTSKAKKREKFRSIKHESKWLLAMAPVLAWFWLRDMGGQTPSDWINALGILIMLPSILWIWFKGSSKYEVSYTREEELWIQYIPDLTDNEIYEVHNLASFQDKQKRCSQIKLGKSPRNSSGY